AEQIGNITATIRNVDQFDAGHHLEPFAEDMGHGPAAGRSHGTAAAPAARCRKVLRGSFILNLPLPSHHSTTSSASASSVFGTLRPIAFAVFRLSTNRKRVGCSTGRSAGLVPLKMRSTRAAERSKISRRSGPYDIKPPSRVSESVS